MKYQTIYGPSWISSLPDKLQQDLFNGNSIVLGSKIYQVCYDCHTLVQVNKPIVGSMHFCN